MKKIALQRGIQFYVSENIEKRVLYSGNELFMDIWEDAFVRIMLQSVGPGRGPMGPWTAHALTADAA